MAGSGGDPRRGALLLELLIALLLVAIVGAAVVALLVQASVMLETGELRGRAAPHLRELELVEIVDAPGQTELGTGTLRWQAEPGGLRVHLESVRDPERPIAAWLVPRPSPPAAPNGSGEGP